MEYKIDNIKKFSESGDWICGQFLKDGLLNTDLVEVKVSQMDPGFVEPEHIHPIGIDVVIILEGEVSYKIGGEVKCLTDGDFIFIKNPVPEAVVEVHRTTRYIVIRTPSVKDNKTYV